MNIFEMAKNQDFNFHFDNVERFFFFCFLLVIVLSFQLVVLSTLLLLGFDC